MTALPSDGEKLTVAVVGARGFIGSRLVERLAASGMEVVPIARTGSKVRLAEARDADALTEAFAGCDMAVHTIAGDAAMITGAIPPLLEAAQRAGLTRIVYISSASVHGQSPAPDTNEDSALAVSQPFAYNTAKARAETTLMTINRQDGDGADLKRPEISILRPGIVYGPRARWFTEFAQEWQSGTACLINGGAGICNACHIDNLCEAVRLALTKPQAANQIFLVGDAEEMHWSELYAPVAAAMERSLEDVPEAPVLTKDIKSPHRFHPDRLIRRFIKRRDVRPQISKEMALLQSCSVRLPTAKATRVLGYRPPVSKAQGLAEAEAWLREARPWQTKP